jgi:hypothetical protein
MHNSFIPIPQPTGERDAEREERIMDEAIVDAHDDEEVFVSWYYYLQDILEFPFQAYVRVENPKQVHMRTLVTVLEMSAMELCSIRSIWFVAQVKNSSWYFNIPASDITEVQAGEETVQALADWKYWIRN